MAARIGLVSTFPPTQCGIASFSHALVTHLVRAGTDVGVVRLVDTPQPAEPFVAAELVVDSAASTRDAAAVLNGFDLAMVQHEYGIFGGADGRDVIDLLDQVRVPVVTVLHTVLSHPTPHQHEVLADVVRRSSVVVTMTETARRRLVDGWGVEPSRVSVIAHGAEDSRVDGDVVTAFEMHTQPTVLTWGLLGQGKGIEWALEAMAGLRDLPSPPLYRVVGRTHPRVVERQGESYRRGLEEAVRRLDLGASVAFDDRYLDGPSLRRIVRDADVVLLPYDSQEQVTSGVLTEAVVAGKPVVSTAFPHAVELLASGAGIVVPQRDPAAIRDALAQVLTEPGAADRMAAVARRIAPGLLWPAVAERYVELGGSLLASHAQSVA